MAEVVLGGCEMESWSEMKPWSERMAMHDEQISQPELDKMAMFKAIPYFFNDVSEFLILLNLSWF